jgi:hypothetical protein
MTLNMKLFLVMLPTFLALTFWISRMVVAVRKKPAEGPRLLDIAVMAAGLATTFALLFHFLQK